MSRLWKAEAVHPISYRSDSVNHLKSFCMFWSNQIFSKSLNNLTEVATHTQNKYNQLLKNLGEKKGSRKGNEQ